VKGETLALSKRVASPLPLELFFSQTDGLHSEAELCGGANMKPGLAQVVFGLAVLATSAAVIAIGPQQWETATVISQTIGSSTMGECGGESDGKSNTVVVDTGSYRYSWQEITSGSDWHHFIVLTGHDGIAHEQVKFYRDGERFVISDDQGDKHKFCLLQSMKFQ
jgi:hypothetical protein